MGIKINQKVLNAFSVEVLSKPFPKSFIFQEPQKTNDCLILYKLWKSASDVTQEKIIQYCTEPDYCQCHYATYTAIGDVGTSVCKHMIFMSDLSTFEAVITRYRSDLSDFLRGLKNAS